MRALTGAGVAVRGEIDRVAVAPGDRTRTDRGPRVLDPWMDGWTWIMGGCKAQAHWSQLTLATPPLGAACMNGAVRS